jgi:hypothetical protein
MNQGMVASVFGKFTNTSAHTSYLSLLKSIGRHPSTARKRFASFYHPYTSKAAAQPFRFTALEDAFSESPPCYGRGCFIIADSQNTVNVHREDFDNQIPRGAAAGSWFSRTERAL